MEQKYRFAMAFVLLSLWIAASAVGADWELSFRGHVPRIDITTVGGVPVTSRTEYVAAHLTLDGSETFASLSDSVLIRGRGNTSWRAYPKKSYRLRFAHKQQLFGSVLNRHYVLIANYIDPTLCVNAAALKAARLAGSAYAGHATPVELYLNGEYLGSYLMTEKVRVGSGSVDIDENDGVLLELDVNYDEPQRFVSSRYCLPVMVHHPDGADIPSIARRWEAFEQAVRDGTDLTPHADLDALVRYLFVYDLFCNNEVAHPKSIYCSYEGMDGQITFGPVWDFDWSCGYLGERYFDLPFLEPFQQGQWFSVTPVTDYQGGASAYNGYPFFDCLMHHPQVLPAYTSFCSDTLSKGFLDSLLAYIDRYAAFISSSKEHDSSLWHKDSVEGQVENLKEWLTARSDTLLARSHDYLVGINILEQASPSTNVLPYPVTTNVYIYKGKKILIR